MAVLLVSALLAAGLAAGLTAGASGTPGKASAQALGQAVANKAGKRPPWERSLSEASLAAGRTEDDSSSAESHETGLRPLSPDQGLVEAIFSQILQAEIAASTPRVTTEQPTRDGQQPHRNATLEIIASNGYKPEAHWVLTEDGYKLAVHRVSNPGRKAVLLQHGLLSSSADWVVMGKGHSLAFKLHDAGYDVWLGNFRGNTYSNEHVTLTPKDKAFWDFSWHEKGIYDVPAMIDYVLNTTQQEQLAYIGYSESTTAFLVTASTKPEYNLKVAGFVALTPVAFLSNMKSIAMKLINKALTASSLLTDMLGMYQFAPALSFINKISKRLCSNLSTLLQLACSNTMFLFLGFNPNQLLQEKIPDIVANVPSSTSTKTLIHFAQLSSREHFRQYDYGIVRNFIHYKRIKPPEYKLWKVVVPTYIHYAPADALATPEDVEKLRDRLINVKSYRKVPIDSFNHIDVLYGKDANEQLYGSVVENVIDAIGPPIAGATASPQPRP